MVDVRTRERYSFLRIATAWSFVCLATFKTVQGFTTPSCSLAHRVSSPMTTTTQLSGLPFRESSIVSLLLSDEEVAIGGAVGASDAFTDQIDYFGDPMIRTLFLVFGGVVVILGALAVLSQKMDAAIESVLADFESVMKTSPEFRDRWDEIDLQLKVFDNEVEKAQKRKQKLFEIMEQMEEKEPAFMKRVSAKMAALNSERS